MRIILISFVILLYLNELYAQADLMITPIRVLFEGRKQRETLNLINVGKETSTYSISFIQYDMTEEGGMIQIKDTIEGKRYASPFLRVFPRQVTLAPGESQSISLQLRRDAEMTDGEYRSHLYFRAEKSNEPLGSSKKSKDSISINVSLKPIFGISTAVIVRNGKTNASASLSDLNIVFASDSSYHLKLTINRTGNISLYGDISVEYLPEKGKPYSIGIVRGLGVYTNIDKRHISMRLNITPGMNMNQGSIRVKYTCTEDKKQLIYAEEVLNLK